MTNILNPYIAGAPVVETSMFFGREDIFGWIERSLTGKFVNHILVLHGQRRVGKTSVLKQIPRHLPQHYVQVFFDLQGRTNTTLDRFLWWMASEISRTLKKECNLDIPKVERTAFSDPEAFINEFLPSLRTLIGDKVLLLTFDEFDTLDRPDIQDSLARPLIAFLRRLMEIEGFNFIFSIGSSGNKLENMQASYTDFFKSALYRKVSFLTKDDCVRLITKPVEGTIIYEPAAVENISHFTSGHPYFTQLMCHELFSRCQKTGRRVISSHDVDMILEDVIERGTVNLKFVWDEASDLEKWILATLAQVEGASLKHVHQILKEQGLRASEADLNSAILHLRDKDVLTENNRFVIQLMKLWLQTNRPMDRVREELVQTNPISDRYIEIGDEYRERGENQQAIQSYQQALQVQANNVRALGNIAAIQLSQDEHANAAETFKKILAIDDENIAARQGFGQAQMAIAKAALNEDREEDAERAYKAILHFNPTNPEANKLLAALYVRQAEGHFRNDQEEQGLEKFNQAIALTPEDASIKQRYEKLIAEKRAKQVQEWLDKAEKSLARQRWEEAASMVEEAINIDPDNPQLRKKLLDIKDAPRQEKISSYKREAEQAIAKGNYPKATSAIQTAILLAPEDASLKEWLDSIQSDQANAQLRLLQSQADQAEAAGNWEVAIEAREAALKLDPQNERLIKALQLTEHARRGHQLKSLRARIDQAKKDQNWDAALSAAEEFLLVSPDDQDVRNESETLRVEQHKSRLVNLKTKAITASKAEKWEEAIQYWQAYLAEQPEEGEKIKSLIEQAKQKAALLKDYETAQAHIRKRQYNRAIHLLQGIIAKDPTYKASSRLLVEAVEANKERKPFWKTPWLYAGVGIVLVTVVVIIFIPQIKTLVNPSEAPAVVTEGNSTPTVSASPTPTGRVLTVNNTNDNGVASLRYTIMNAQKYDTIKFNPVFFPPDNPATIFLESELPRISQGYITLDASNAGVIIDGSALPDETFGLIISSNANKVMGLQIINCPGIGIYVEGGSHNQIGGDRTIGDGPTGQGNLISNNWTGINLLSIGGGNVITGNLIGTELDGYTPMGNIGPGISIEKNETISPIPNTIGPDNIIAYNNIEGGGPGIELMTGMLSTHITQNLIFENGGKGISYFENNAEVEPPVIIYHDLEDGVVSGQACSGCEVEIFSTYQNEGEIFEGSVKADDFGNFVFNKGEALSGPNLTAIAISSANKTSEFSNPPSSTSAMRAAMNYILTESPDYESSFDFWEFGDPGENVTIENGKLILPSGGRNVGQGVSEQSADKFAVQFDFQIPESDPEGTCFFGMGNDQLHRSLGVGFRSDGYTFVEEYIHPDQYPRIAESNYQYFGDQTNQGLFIIVEDQISVFLNDRLVFSFFDPLGSVVYNFQSVHAEWGVTCEFDNYKIWNLEGLEFDQWDAFDVDKAMMEEQLTIINVFRNETPPTFEDDFSTAKPEWGEIQKSDGTFPISDDLKDEKLNLLTPGGVEYIILPINGLLNASEFIVAFDFEYIQRTFAPNNAIFGVKFFHSTTNSSEYDLRFIADGTWEIVANKVGGYQYAVLDSGTYSIRDMHQVMLSVFDNNIFLTINNQPISLIEGIANNEISNYFYFNVTDGQGEINIDNFKFWNLEGVEIGNSEPTSSEENKLSDQLISYSRESSPIFEDDFSTAKSEWGLVSVDGIDGSGNFWSDRSNLSEYIENEKLVFDEVHATFPENNLFEAKNFAVSFDFNNIPASSLMDMNFRFRSNNTGDAYYEVKVQAGHTKWNINYADTINNKFEIFSQGSFSGRNTKILIIAYDDHVFLFLNDALVSDTQIPISNYDRNFIRLESGFYKIEFDNFQFWNLDGVEIQP